MKTRTFLPVFALIIAYGCGGGQSEQPAAAGPETAKPAEKAKTCTYTYNQEGTKVEWVAYKYTEKTAVSGVFEAFQIMNAGEGSTPAEVLQNASFEITTGSVNSGDPTRDPKIKESFFGSLENGDVLSGTVTSAAGDDQKGEVVFNLAMNGVDQPVNGTYTVKDDQLEVTAKINVETWSAMPAIQALNKVCEDLHKGADGTSILWPDVSLFLTASLNKNCE